MGRPEYCSDGKGSGYSSWFHGYETEVWGILNTVQMERGLGTVAGSMVTVQRFGVSLNTIQMERDLGTVAGSMVTEQRFGAS